MSLLQDVWPYVAALLPTAGLLWLFYVLMKHIVEGDRRERAAQREWEARLDRGRVGEGEAERAGARADPPEEILDKETPKD